MSHHVQRSGEKGPSNWAAWESSWIFMISVWWALACELFTSCTHCYWHCSCYCSLLTSWLFPVNCSYLNINLHFLFLQFSSPACHKKGWGEVVVTRGLECFTKLQTIIPKPWQHPIWRAPNHSYFPCLSVHVFFHNLTIAIYFKHEKPISIVELNPFLFNRCSSIRCGWMNPAWFLMNSSSYSLHFLS